MSADNVIFGVDFKRHIYNADRQAQHGLCIAINPTRDTILRGACMEIDQGMPSDSPPYVAPEGDSA